jgi:hypothetical protein
MNEDERVGHEILTFGYWSTSRYLPSQLRKPVNSSGAILIISCHVLDDF